MMNEEQDENRIWWYQGEVEDEGPYTLDEIIQFRKDGVLNDNSQILNKELGFWYMFRDIPISDKEADIEQLKERIVKETNENAGLVGIGGWLILVAIGVIAAPILLLSSIRQFEGMLIQLKTTIGVPESYITLFESMNFFNYLFLLASFAMVYLFFYKKRNFPKMYIIYSVLSIIIGSSFIIAMYSILPEYAFFTIWDQLKGTFLTSLLSSIAWIMYMLTSRRVKNTFVC